MLQCTLSELNIDYINKLSESRNEPSWLKDYRASSIVIYDKLPHETSSLYSKYTNAKMMNSNQIYLSINHVVFIPQFIKDRMNELKNELNIIQLGSNIYQINIPENLKSDGLIISSISDALKNNFDLVQRSFKTMDSKLDKYTALNNAAFDSGIFIYIPKHLVLKNPIYIIGCLSNNISTISRNIIFVDEDSKANVIQEIYATRSHIQNAYIELLDAFVSSDSTLDLTSLQIMDQNSINFSTRRTNVDHDGKVNWYLGLFGSMLSRYKIDHYLTGIGASVTDSEVIFGNKDQSFDISTSVHHEKPHTNAKIIEKSILKDTSKSLFKGMIRIKENANKSQSFLSGHSILLDKGAKSDSIPGLEIFTNDVKATHSASVAQIDSDQIYYLQSRCLSKTEAERIIIEGFLEPLSRTMSYQVRAWISYLIESKWKNRELIINTDEQLKKLIEIEETRYNEKTEIDQHYKYR